MRTTIAATARMLDVPVSTVRRRIEQAKIPTMRLGNYVLVDPAEVQAAMRMKRTVIYSFGDDPR